MLGVGKVSSTLTSQHFESDRRESLCCVLSPTLSSLVMTITRLSPAVDANGRGTLGSTQSLFLSWTSVG